MTGPWRAGHGASVGPKGDSATLTADTHPRSRGHVGSRTIGSPRCVESEAVDRGLHRADHGGAVVIGALTEMTP